MQNSIPIDKPVRYLPKKNLISILKMNTSTNKFVIVKEQLEQFKKQITNSCYFKSFSTWYSFFSQKGEKNLPLLFSPFERNHKNIFDDQIRRSKFIVDYMKKFLKSELITMDGHGRLIYSIINEFQKDKSFIRSKRRIHLIDIDETTNEFHKEMYPEKIFKKAINIPEPQDILELDNLFLEKNKISNAFLYLNFCGIGCCSTDKQSGIERLVTFIKKWLEFNDTIMISLSLRPYGFKTHYKGKLTTYGMLQEIENKELISRRSSFVTYFINK